jgi:hypothetical protein
VPPVRCPDADPPADPRGPPAARVGTVAEAVDPGVVRAQRGGRNGVGGRRVAEGGGAEGGRTPWGGRAWGGAPVARGGLPVARGNTVFDTGKHAV